MCVYIERTVLLLPYNRANFKAFVYMVLTCWVACIKTGYYSKSLSFVSCENIVPSESSI